MFIHMDILKQNINPINPTKMKQKSYYLKVLAILAICLTLPFLTCKKEEEVPTTTVSTDITETDPMNIGETLTVQVSIVAGEVVTFNVYKVVDNVKGSPTLYTSNLSVDGNNYSFTFNYVLEEGDDLHTLGFEFEVTDGKNKVTTASVLVNTILSIRSSFIKYDWKITAEHHAVWGDLLAAHDAAKIFRFNEDGTYEVDLGTDPAHLALAVHHDCFWIYKETPSNGDTIAVLRLIRRLPSGETAADEVYDFRITAASESEMTMFWDIAVWGILDIQRTFTSQPKGAFVPYGTEAKAAEILGNELLDCSLVDESLLTIE